MIEQRFEKVALSRTFSILLDSFQLRKKKVFDLGCGYGEYLKLFGKGSVGITTTPGEVDYGKEHGLPIILGNVEEIDKLNLKNDFEAVWANNLFEHLVSPHAFLVNLKTVSADGALLILGVPVVPKLVSLMRTRYFRGALASNHINFFTHTTLQLTVERAGWKVQSARPFIFKNSFLDAIIRPFAPHIYVIARNDAAFLYPDKKLKEWDGQAYYENLLKVTKQL
jgi:SAM-dependent methyltransferase